MKKSYFPLLLFLICFSTFVKAQLPAHTHTSIDSRLFEVFESSYLNNLVTENPFLLQRWNYYLDHAWFITNLPPEKMTTDYPSVRIEDLDAINILLLEREQQLRRDWEKRMIYRIEGQEKALVLYSGKEFTRMLNEYLGRQYGEN